jgi:hypothetical protein
MLNRKLIGGLMLPIIIEKELDEELLLIKLFAKKIWEDLLGFS